MMYLPPLVSRQYDKLDSRFLSPQVLRYYYQSFIRFLIYFPSYVAPVDRVFVLGQTSRLGSSQSWVNSGTYLAPKIIIQRLKPLLHKDCMSKLLSYLVAFHPISKLRDFFGQEVKLHK